MCGRFTLTTDDYESVVLALGARIVSAHTPSFRARYNIAPSDAHWIVVSVADDGERHREMQPAVWGLPPPSGARRSDRPGVHINARSETAHRRPTFRDAFAHARCGVVADGFYEWSGPKSDRQPYWFHTPDRAPVLFAGLYRDQIVPDTGEVVRRFAILTTPANALVEPFHDRMPAVLDPATYDRWLGPAPIEVLQSLLVPAPVHALVSTPVSKRVNSPRFDDARCVEPRDRPRQQPLF